MQVKVAIRFGVSMPGARVSNTWVTYPLVWDNIWKRMTIPDTLFEGNEAIVSPKDGPADD